jgi:histone H3/H4
MLSDNSIKKILKNAGALRVGKDAIKKLKKLTENYSLIIARKAVKNAEYSGRKSIKTVDIEEAIKIEE